MAQERTKDQQIATSILNILGRIDIPIYKDSELQIAVDIRQMLAKIANGESLLTAVKPDKKSKSGKKG